MKEIKKEVRGMYNLAMGNLLNQYAITHKRFLTQKEFEDNRGKILLLTDSKTKLDKLINSQN